MIGNDVVDIKLASTQSDWRRKGFLEKVFTSREQQQISMVEDLDMMVWLFWSMKEAAYKAHQREHRLSRKLNWRRQKCEVTEFDNAGASGVVTIEDEQYFSSSDIYAGAIFTSAVKDKNIRFKNGFFESPSEEMKRRFFEEVSRLYQLPKRKLELQKNNDGIPRLMCDKKEYPCAFSFTGHGGFSAFSFALMNC